MSNEKNVKQQQTVKRVLDRLIKVELRLGHIPYSKNKDSLFQKYSEERENLYNAIIEFPNNFTRRNNDK